MIGFIGHNFGARPSGTLVSQAIDGEVPHIVRGDDSIVEHEIDALDDSPAGYTCVFGLFNHQIEQGAVATGEVVESATPGKWTMRTELPSGNTLGLQYGTAYKWTHTLLSPADKILTQFFGDTRLIDGYAVDRL